MTKLTSVEVWRSGRGQETVIVSVFEDGRRQLDGHPKLTDAEVDLALAERGFRFVKIALPGNRE